jgi:hypothetical protein
VEVTKPTKATLREGTGWTESAAGLTVSSVWFIGKSFESGEAMGEAICRSYPVNGGAERQFRAAAAQIFSC